MQKRQTIALLAIFAIVSALIIAGLLTWTNKPLNHEELRQQAWQVFERYIEAARIQDLETLSLYSHELSTVCQEALSGVNEEATVECQNLMASVVTVAENFEFEKFVYVFRRDADVSIYTDYEDQLRTIISFKFNKKDLRVSGIRFCLEGSDPAPECFDDFGPPSERN
jgi:hypothetical protein